MNKRFKKQVKYAKETFYKNMIANLRQKNPSQWYSSLKRITGNDQKSEKVIISQIFHKSDQDQAEVIADYFSSIPNEYDPIKKDDIPIPHFSENQMLQFHTSMASPYQNENQ